METTQAATTRIANGTGPGAVAPAYMAYSFTKSEWRILTEAVLGLTEYDAEVVLRSKAIRHASDSATFGPDHRRMENVILFVISNVGQYVSKLGD